jgi:guanine deaminase
MKYGLKAYLIKLLAPDPMPLDAERLLYLATRAGAEALKLEEEIGDLRPGKAADFVHVRPPAGSVLESVVRRAGSADQVLAALFTMGGAESVYEVQVEGDIVFSQSHDD